MEGVGLLHCSWPRHSVSAFITSFITSSITFSCKWRGRRLVLSHALAKKSSFPAYFLSLFLSLRNVSILSTPSLSPFRNLLKFFLHFLLALSVLMDNSDPVCSSSSPSWLAPSIGIKLSSFSVSSSTSTLDWVLCRDNLNDRSMYIPS